MLLTNQILRQKKRLLFVGDVNFGPNSTCKYSVVNLIVSLVWLWRSHTQQLVYCSHTRSCFGAELCLRSWSTPLVCQPLDITLCTQPAEKIGIQRLVPRPRPAFYHFQHGKPGADYFFVWMPCLWTRWWWRTSIEAPNGLFLVSEAAVSLPWGACCL